MTITYSPPHTPTPSTYRRSAFRTRETREGGEGGAGGRGGGAGGGGGEGGTGEGGEVVRGVVGEAACDSRLKNASGAVFATFFFPPARALFRVAERRVCGSMRTLDILQYAYARYIAACGDI